MSQKGFRRVACSAYAVSRNPSKPYLIHKVHHHPDLLLLPLGPSELLRLDVAQPAVGPAGAPEGEGHVARGHAVQRDGDDVRRQHDEHVVAEKQRDFRSFKGSLFLFFIL